MALERGFCLENLPKLPLRKGHNAASKKVIHRLSTTCPQVDNKLSTDTIFNIAQHLVTNWPFCHKI